MGTTKYTESDVYPYSCWSPPTFEETTKFLESIQSNGFLIFQHGRTVFHLYEFSKAKVEVRKNQGTGIHKQNVYALDLGHSLCGSTRSILTRSILLKDGVEIEQQRSIYFYWRRRFLRHPQPFFSNWWRTEWRFMKPDFPSEFLCRSCVKKSSFDLPTQLKLFA